MTSQGWGLYEAGKRPGLFRPDVQRRLTGALDATPEDLALLVGAAPAPISPPKAPSDGLQARGRAFEADIGPGWELVAVNDRAASAEVLRDAVTAAKGTDKPINLLLKNGDRYRTVAFDYHDGLRYPRLERIPGTPDRLGDILSPRRR